MREAVNGNEETTVRVLLDAIGAEREIIVNMAPAGQNTLLFLSSSLGNEKIVKLLIETGGSDGRAHPVTFYSPLYISCLGGHEKVTKLLLKHFPELVQQKTVEKWLPFHAAVINGHIPIVELLIKFEYPENVLQTFTDPVSDVQWKLPFDPNAQDVTSQTALYVACLLGNKTLVNMLLKWKVKCERVRQHDLDDSPHKSVSQTPQQVLSPLSPSGRRVSLGIMSIMSKLTLGREQTSDESGGEMKRNPIELNLLCGASRETALLASVRGGYLDVVQLLLQYKADPNIVARPLEDPLIDPRLAEEIYGFCNSPLAEATRQKSLAMVELLLKFNAKDDESIALGFAVQNNDEQIICKLLSIKAHPDPDYKINKKAIGSPETEFRPILGNLTFSSLFPNTPTMVNWHSNNFRLQSLKINWLVEAALQCNAKLKGHPKLAQVSLTAITRIDISNNALVEIPQEIFTLLSLRYLNLSQNKLEKIPIEDVSSPSKSPKKQATRYEYNVPVLEELYLQDNRLTLIPPSLFKLPSLQILDVANNKLQELPFEIWKSPKLRELNVAFNLLKDLPSLPPEELCCSSEILSPVADAYLFSNLGFDDKGSKTRNTVSKIELIHHNVWSKSLEVTEQEVQLPDAKNDLTVSQLSSLNLANNLFTSIPLALPCLAVNLTRLNLSYNSLRSMGHITSYPSSLKQLDLGHNEISCWPSLPRIAASDPHLACYNPQQVDLMQSALASKSSSTSSHNSEVPVQVKASASSSNITSLRTAVMKSVCSHRRHLRLDSLRTLILADNLLTRIQLSTDDVSTLGESDEYEWSVVGVAKSRLIFPNLSMLDISNNCLKEIPLSIHELSNLSVLNISGNPDVTELPPMMGLLSRLWNLNTRGCSLQEPLKGMIDSKKYKTMDIIGYLKSVFEDARKYARMKLMVVGIQRIGKTSLLEMLRNETGGSKSQKKQVDHWAKRMGHKNIINTKTTRGNNISTVGVDIGDWVCDRKRTQGPVIFRTWDFGGQKEYYATHQYFLSKRSLYLVLWRIIDGKKGLAEVLQWLGNIQARAPNSPCIIVGTHYDEVGEKFPPEKAEELQQIIRDRFIAVADAEKMGLPRVLDSIEVSCKTGHNIKLLSNLIYDTAFSLRLPGSKEFLLQQKVPASYLALEDVVASISNHLKQNGADPVLKADNYREMVTVEMSNRGYKGFRDNSELNQATMFLHDNGVLLHYDDATLRDLYFLDPQWLCDMLAHVVTVREINPFARSGVMRIDDLQLLFKNSCLGSNESRNYIVSLLNKFEVALTWDTRTLLIPSLLPTEEESLNGKAIAVKIVSKSRNWMTRTPKSLPIATAEELSTISDESTPSYELYPITKANRSISRLLLMSYFPSGFWSRLITRILADDQVVQALKCIYPLTKEAATNPCLNQALNSTISFYWSIWQTGLSLFYGNILIFKMREIPASCHVSPYRNNNNRFKLKQEGVWCDIDLINQGIMELSFPMHAVGIKPVQENLDLGIEMEIDINIQSTTQLLALIVDHIDLLLEDWYPTLGTRFVHTSEGRFLVTRLVPCQQCLTRCDERNSQNQAQPPASGSKFSKAMFKKISVERNRDGELGGLNDFSGILNEIASASGGDRKSQDSIGYSDCDSGVDPNSACSSRTTSVEGHPLMNSTDQLPPPSYCWMVEECILAAYDRKAIHCPAHGEIDLTSITPDINFLDLSESNLIRPDEISRGQLLGRGAFGFVFKATYKHRGNRQVIPVAMKMLQPVAPGPRANQSAIVAYKAALGKWERDPLQHACKAYCTARQELSVLLTLKHPNIVPLIGVCTQPLALVLDLAPKGALDVTLRHFRRSGARIGPYCFQSIVLQTARALEYLHRRRVIYRDLKSENILVFEFPEPHTPDHPGNSVLIKMADYGISRIVLPSGSKGFGGTEGFMAPEIMKHNGEEEYTEKVDCFSFGMFLYELIALRQPFEGHEAVKECILDGNRPVLTQRETQFPSYCLDLMILCWDQNPRIRPTASQIVSIGSAPEFTHLLDIVSLSHPGVCYQGLSYPISTNQEQAEGYELWLPCSNSRIDLLLCSPHGWQQYHKISCPQLFTSIQQQQMLLNKNSKGMKLTCCVIIESNIWIGDSDGNIHAFNASDCSHLFSYSLEIAIQDCSVVTLIYLDKINRVAAGLNNGRLFLLDSKLIPKTSASAEGSFVLTELGTGDELHAACSVWRDEG